MHGDAEAFALGSVLPQPAFSAASSTTPRRRPVSIGNSVVRLAVVPQILRHADRLGIDDPRRSDQLEQELLS